MADIWILGALAGPIEPVSRPTERIPAPEFVGISVERVGAALGYHIDDGAGVAADIQR